MLFRLHALYLRYVAHHADRLGGFSLPRERRRKLGRIEQVKREGGVTRIIGWTSARQLRLTWPGGEVTIEPSIQRADVARRYGLALETGFQIEAPEGLRPLMLHVPRGQGEDLVLPVPHPSDPPSPAARRRLLRSFVVDVLRAGPALLRWTVTRDPGARKRIKRILGLDAVREGLPIDPRYLTGAVPPRSLRAITIILPVYNAFDLLAETLRRVEAHTDVDWHMILIDDASPDPRVRPFLRAWVDGHPGRVTLIELDQNLGFIGAVNRGFEEAEHHAGHVVLLNSDAHVPEGWASRLIAPFDRDPKIASVTPMSNDAEIFSAPMICQSMPLPAGLVDRIDAVAQTLSVPDRLPSAPTGVGFCMAMNARWFGREPRFDTAFGRGYGEEVDWCQKLRKAGARHVGLPTLFVEHRGGQSFGGDAKLNLVLRANAMIARRYPAYDVEVQAYIGRDPLRTPRLALAIAMAGYTSIDPLPLFLAHSLGGGADQALNAEIESRTAQGQSALVLRIGGALRWQVELHGPGGVVSGATPDLADVRRLLAPVPALRIVYSCGVGDRDPVSLPGALLSLRRPGAADWLEARVHDYFMVSPSYCLLNADGAYRGPVTRDTTDPAHRLRRPDGSEVRLGQWQDAWEPFLSACQEITVFSDSSRQHMVASYPGIADHIVYRPHTSVARIGRVEPPGHGGLADGTVAVLGNLNLQKGAGVLCAMAEMAAQRGGPRMVLIGNMDVAFSRPPSLRLHGSYDRHDIAQLAQRYGVSAWLVPSIWPETFSFVTHEMLATGLPVYGFDIGAQGEALRRAANGIAIPFDPDVDHAAAILAAISGTPVTNTANHTKTPGEAAE
ncbi:glycosyltransferase [Roseicyclus mahoneyensis]|uniref:GT2 family glycosyltransferase n=1 Tax=Roseicyclus mahoneyensis TaxID=164332 RepID=A0A316GHR3_9RHOB|nr:glycosyltransferase [Roseicyclus mahoneyensis]PWK60110.1 GT2 family glycosyltransferase [Roseicyclus mahoneyensis]